MNQYESDIHEIEVTIEHAREKVEFANAIRRLEKNADFRKVFTDGYFRDEASRLTLLLGDKNISDKDRDGTVISLRAVGELHTFLRVGVLLGDQMAAAIEDGQEAIEAIHAEEANANDPNAEGSDAE